MLHFEGLRKKVIKNYFIIIIIMVTLFEGLFMFYIQNYYYDSVKQLLESEIKYADEYNAITMETTSFEKKVKNIFDKQPLTKNSGFGISIIDKDKNIILDQYGFKSKEKANYEDVNNALKDIKTKNLTPYTYRIPDTGEHVMSISLPLKVNNIIEGVVRYTVSLDAIDNAILKQATWLILAGIFILIIAILISLKFAETLIKPLRELKKFANELAVGNYNIKLEKMKIVDDEIGDLAQTFEHMAHEIDKSEKLKEEFISSVSHELRTPLTSIKGWSETLGYESITREELDLGLGIIQDETERLIKLVEELLDFSRLSSDRIKLHVDIVDVEGLIVGVVNQLKVKAAEKDISLLFEFENEFIENIQGDKNRLRQVLINLIQNSFKFTSQGGYIKVVASQDEEITTISVEDNGSGIEKQNLNKVLDKFFQEDYNKAGSGLGLAISNEIVKLHGGRMKIESEKNVGTKITFNIKNKFAKQA
ncbi:cell wall metabolism sensor histidine kinase WalK [Clostridioides difficile]|uniref:cell wall metabolism sensor histidine kinase WalK n=1 Tax=Clostridioides difficile TaxID=1496 RepID=UPI00107EB119|nr:cell wall metabolism sensor histidine kinase WalK [Clostridioides difficile]TGA06800.1 HAMP domain-containing histidine kinase [Clostridioides difficile]